MRPLQRLESNYIIIIVILLLLLVLLLLLLLLLFLCVYSFKPHLTFALNLKTLSMLCYIYTNKPMYSAPQINHMKKCLSHKSGREMVLPTPHLPIRFDSLQNSHKGMQE